VLPFPGTTDVKLHNDGVSQSFGLQGELDELEREEFFRLKKVQDKKQRDVDRKKEEQEAAKKAMMANGKENGRVNGEASGAGGNMLATQDEDELF
jgi:V-type H+-transporting ATPase subunit D